MNDLVRAILARRSVRKFLLQPVAEDDIRDLLKAAMSAPSAVAADPWHFVVLRDPSILVRLSEALPHGRHLAHAPLGILVCGNTDSAHRKQLAYLLQDCSAAIENLLLAASMMGLGACWLGIHPNPERVAHTRRLFSLPPPIVPVAVVAVGYPDEQPRPRTRFREEAVHWEQW